MDHQDINAILKDIYDITGVKVSADDPIVTAALIQSQTVKNAGDQIFAGFRNEQKEFLEKISTLKLDDKLIELSRLVKALETSKELIVGELALKTKNKILDDFYGKAKEDRKELKKLIFIGTITFSIVQIFIFIIILLWLK